MEYSDLQKDFFRAMHRMKSMNQLFQFGDLSRLEFFVLEGLFDFQTRHPEKKGMYASDLAALMRTSPPAMSRMLRSLEEEGYLERTVDRDSRRNTFIHLTERGIGVRQDIHDEMDRTVQRIITAMGEDDLHELLALWGRLMDVIQRETKSSKEGETPCSK